MPSANVYDMDGNVLRQEELDPYVFGAPVNVGLLHQVVTAQLTNRRQGTASTKTRAQVSGGNKKPYRQKGTGRARQGSTRAPQFRGGGVVFGPHPHPYERKIPRKMKRLAIRAALSDKANEGRILLMDAINFESPSTRDMLDLVERLPLERHLLVLMPDHNQNVILSARNIHRVKMGRVDSINVVELLKYDHLLLPVASVQKIVETFGEAADDALQMKRHPRVVYRRQIRRAQAAFAGKGAGATAAAPAAPAAEAAPAAQAKPKARAVKSSPAKEEAPAAAVEKPVTKTTRTTKTAKATEPTTTQEPPKSTRAPRRSQKAEEE
jgi:large subunit ribosomal protein L4